MIIFDKVDTEQSGMITFSEFLAISISPKEVLTRDILGFIFNTLNSDNSGYLDIS